MPVGRMDSRFGVVADCGFGFGFAVVLGLTLPVAVAVAVEVVLAGAKRALQPLRTLALAQPDDMLENFSLSMS